MRLWASQNDFPSAWNLEETELQQLFVHQSVKRVSSVISVASTFWRYWFYVFHGLWRQHLPEIISATWMLIQNITAPFSNKTHGQFLSGWHVTKHVLTHVVSFRFGFSFTSPALRSVVLAAGNPPSRNRACRRSLLARNGGQLHVVVSSVYMRCVQTAIEAKSSLAGGRRRSNLVHGPGRLGRSMVWRLSGGRHSP